jgi:acyl-CoA reductase-like NAD-dependent aldehyde dehydrogenase
MLSDIIALHNALSPIMASIFAGNGVVLKCSEHVIWSTNWYVRAVKECLRACGHDPELVQVCSPVSTRGIALSIYAHETVSSLLPGAR